MPTRKSANPLPVLPVAVPLKVSVSLHVLEIRAVFVLLSGDERGAEEKVVSADDLGEIVLIGECRIRVVPREIARSDGEAPAILRCIDNTDDSAEDRDSRCRKCQAY